MLRGIHKASSTWVGKAIMGTVMGFLILSFAIWGIGDIFRGFGANSVAKVGGSEITIEQFRQYYTDKLQQLGQQLRRPITPDQARGLGLDQRFLGQLVAETTLDEEARKMRLGLSDKAIAERIMADPNFKGLNGQFDRGRFEQIIRNAGFSEQRYVAEQRNVLLRRQIAQSVSGDLAVPQTMLDAVNHFQNERRSIEYIQLGAAQAGDIPQPTADDLAKYFEARKVTFRAPEYRKVTLLALTPAELAKPDAVPEADAKLYYDQRKDSFGTPEKREVRQIVFPNAEDAAAAEAKIKGGASFDDVVKERGLKPGDTDLGLVAKSEIIDPAVASAAFSLKSGEVSAPVKGTFGTVLLTVGKIEAGNQKTYEEVAPQIKQQIAEQRARNDINDLRDKIEDERAAGSTLAEAARKLNLKVTQIDGVDRSGRGPDGKPVTAIPRSPDAISAVFGTDVGVDNEALQLPDGGYLYYDVTGVTPSRDRTLDEVKDQVTERWRNDEIAKRLKATSEDMLGKLKSGTPLAQLATENNLKVETAFGLQRGRAAAGLPPAVSEAAFSTGKGEAGVADSDNGDRRYLFRVTDVSVPPIDPQGASPEQLKANLQNSYADDIIGQYITRIESDVGVSINQQAVNQVVGGQTNQ
ncbi:peptidylprolyl isomerase [Pseudolabrys sp. Root1462]|uniref:SurA N-terminal domain-containing protein n=1 Tax=Pseudolabrys sp. Root1462 TaxID=1736466 RepID=UPI000702EFD7|nr:SurA N-terminal domain-containing protein [Pseudolabrys sp. Root1462]KQZ01015.1 peptidylprolyl isomerase [Pseudolabrys sp. Root1462]